jgi:hypothetical protein
MRLPTLIWSQSPAKPVTLLIPIYPLSFLPSFEGGGGFYGGFLSVIYVGTGFHCMPLGVSLFPFLSGVL